MVEPAGGLRDRLAFAAVVAACLLATVAFPLYQAAQTGGYVWYMNAFDETTYLQYDFSRSIQGIARPGQFLVTLLHQAGLSGGWINATLDAVALLAFPLLALAILLGLGWPFAAAGLGALGVMLGGLLFGTANPLLAWIHNQTNASDLVYWLNTPEMYVSPLVRSPEPQFSLTLLALAVLVAVRLRSVLPVFPVLPFMYPFVALPAGFMAVATWLWQRWPFPRFGTAGPLLVAFMAIGSGTWLYYGVLVPAPIRALLIASRLPLVSLTGIMALIAFVAFRPAMDARYRFFALALALSPWVASNQQVISGYMAQPNNFEHYWGVFAAAAICVLGTASRPRWALALVLAGGLLFARTSYVAFRVSQADFARYNPPPELITALRDEPGRVVVDDGMLGCLFNMLHPRQGSTALGYEQTYVNIAHHTVDRYRCVKGRILAEHPESERLRGQLRWLDDGFEYGSQNVLITHIKRKPAFVKLQDVAPLPCPPGTPPLRYFWVPAAR